MKSVLKMRHKINALHSVALAKSVRRNPALPAASLRCFVSLLSFFPSPTLWVFSSLLSSFYSGKVRKKEQQNVTRRR